MCSVANDRRALRGDIWAVVPIKETAFAKQRLSIPEFVLRFITERLYER